MKGKFSVKRFFVMYRMQSPIGQVTELELAVEADMVTPDEMQPSQGVVATTHTVQVPLLCVSTFN